MPLPLHDALTALEKLLAQAPSVQDVRADAIGELNARYRINTTSTFHRELEALYERYLLASLEDRHFSDQEIADLKHLKLLFGISDGVANSIREKAVAKVYGAAAEDVTADRRLTPQEADYLRHLETDLQLPAPIAERIYREAGELQLHRYFDSAIHDARLAPDEERELQTISANLGVPLGLDERSQVMYERMKLYWLIENGDMPAIRTELPLEAGEKGYAEQDVEWFESSSATQGIRYGSVSDRVKVAKDIYFRAREAAARLHEDVLEHIDSGRAVLTSKRLLLQGGRSNSTIRLDRVLDFTPYPNGIDIHTDTGKPVFLKLRKDVDLFALKLDRAIRDARTL